MTTTAAPRRAPGPDPNAEPGEPLTPQAFAALLTDHITAALTSLYPRTDGTGPATADEGPAGSPTPLDPVTADAWVGTLTRAGRQIDNLLAQAVRVADDADVEQRFRSGSQHRYLTGRHHLSNTHAHALATTAKWTGLHRGTDTPISAAEPATRAAARTGAISSDHVAAIYRELDKLPETWIPRRQEVERALVKMNHPGFPGGSLSWLPGPAGQAG